LSHGFFPFYYYLPVEEIDNLTRRCKSAETSFSGLTQSLGDVPDPSVVLVTALDYIHTQQAQLNRMEQSVEDLQKENASLDKKVQQQQQQQKAEPSKDSSSGLSRADKEELLQLRKEVAEYEVEFRSLKNQDITIRKLESRIQELQQGGQEEFHSNLEKAKQELAETEGRRTAEALEREAAMERRAQSLELQLKAERAGRQATQAHLLEANEGAGEREAAWEAQRSILVDDAERIRVSLYQATRERDELRLKAAALEGNAPPGVGLAPSSGGIPMADLLGERRAFEAEVSELSHTVNSLREELALKDEVMVEERRSLETKIDTLERQISTVEGNLTSLETQLAAAPSQSLVDSMKRELRILKRLEYNADDPDLDARDPEMTGGDEDHEKDLESVLVAKLRRVEGELVKERNGKEETKEQEDRLREEIASLGREKTEADSTIASLERDLDKAITSSASPSKPSTKKSSTPVIAKSDPADLEHVLDPNAPEPVAHPQPSAAPSSTASAAEKVADDHSVATIIMAQRDRLRVRCEALEAERDSFKRELQEQLDAAESLKTDNTKLFEKMRYLQSYNNSSSSAGRGVYNRTNSRDLDLEALEQRYEASVDPFRQFGRSERQRKLKEMSPMERTVFVVAKTVLGTKEMRTFLFFYVVALHVLVFSTTYHWSHDATGCGAVNEHLSHLPPITDKSPEQVIQDLSGVQSSTT
jgi:homeobox protein cut-like